jgi:hypothetical protein
MRHKYQVRIVVKALVPETELSQDDIETSPVGTHLFDVEAVSRRQALVYGLDAFHATVPIDVLDDFDIDATIVD